MWSLALLAGRHAVASAWECRTVPGHDGDMVETKTATLSKQVLPLFRSRTNLHRWAAVDRYCTQAWNGVSLLEAAVENEGPAAVLAVTQKALTSVGRIMLHADDSNGSIGGVFDRLLEIHARMCAEAPPAHGRLVTWMIRFQFGDGQDVILIDPAEYAPALGPKGLAKYEAELGKVSATIPPEPASKGSQAAGRLHPDGTADWEQSGKLAHARFVLQHNAERLAVVHRDSQRIIDTHAGDQTRSYKLQHTATALAEIGEIGLAIDWAHLGALLENGHQGEAAAQYWCQLLHQHRPMDELCARRIMFERWPSSSNATRLHDAAAEAWPSMQGEVLDRLVERPDDCIDFLLQTLQDVPLAWTEAHRLDLDRTDLWARLIDAYQAHDPAAVLPVLERLLDGDLARADVRNYKMAVARLRKHRIIATAAGCPEATVDLLASIRDRNRNRPRLLRELECLKF